MTESQKWKRAAAVAERQNLVIAVWQLLLLGISETAIEERVRRHRWRRLSRGIIALPGAMTPIRRLTAAVLSYAKPVGAQQRVESAMERSGDVVEAVVAAALGSGQRVCGRSALWLHGVTDVAPEQQWIRLPAKAGHPDRPGIRLRYGDSTGQLAVVQQLPVVDVVQAFKDVAGCDQTRALPLHHELARSIATADALRLVTIDEIAERIASDPRFVGSPALRRVIADLRGELSHSATEKTARRLASEVLARFGLHLHPRPYAIEHGGKTVGEADLAVVEIALDFEIDGPHHLLPAQREKDQQRDRLVRRARWEVERFSTEMVDLHPQQFAAAVEECVRFRVGK